MGRLLRRKSAKIYHRTSPPWVISICPAFAGALKRPDLSPASEGLPHATQKVL